MAGFRFTRTYEYRHFVYQFLLLSAFLPVISTHFPAVKQTGTGVFYLLFVGRLNSKNFQHFTQINNALMLVKVFNNL